MKILKIEFQNINSLKGTHLIDFTGAPFTASSLFAITGPTGSGKSTILDVISLALFNQVPRLGKISRNEIQTKGALLTRNQKEAFAKVTYEGKNGQFTSHWSISTARTGSLRDYEMEIVEESTGKIIDLKKSDVPAKNEELIGLNYNQFIKSVLLAQGEFAQFLRAKKEERGELLEKITGTGIYRQLGKKAFEKHKIVNHEIQKQQDAIAVIEQDLLEEEQLINYTQELEAKETTCAPLEKELEVLGKNLELKKTIEDQLREIDKLSAEKESADVSLKEFEAEFGHQLKQHEKVRDYAEDIRNWTRLQQDCASLDKDVNGKIIKKDENLRELSNCLKEVSGFTQLETAQEKVESNLNAFSKKVRKLQEDLNQKVVEFKTLQREFALETRDLACNLDEKNPDATREQLEKFKNSSEEKLQQLTPLLQDVDLKDPAAEKNRLKKYINDAQEARNHSERINQIVTEINKICSEEEKLAPQLKELPVEIRHNEDKVKLFHEKLKNITLQRQNQLLIASHEVQRANLEDGRPCPLCGAVHHPYAEDLPPINNNLDSQLGEVEKELALWSAKLTRNSTTLNHLKENLHNCTVQKEKLQSELKKQQTEFRENYQHLDAGKETAWKEVIKNFQSKLEQLEEYEQEVSRLYCVEVGLPLIKQMMKLSAEGKELREKLVSVYKGEDIHSDTQKLQTRWTQLRQLEKAIAEQLQELHKKTEETKKQLQTLEQELEIQVKERGFERIHEAVKALLPDPEYFRLQTARDKLDREIAKNQQSLKLLSSQLEKTRKEDVEQTAEELRIKRQEKNTALEKVREECQHLKRLLLNDRERRERLKEIRSQIAEKEKEIRRWKLLNELIGDATGKKFNDFAQDLSLSQLLQLANVRLGDLSDRYKIDKPKEEEDDGLVAIDEHMGGQRRSVKTLSGGETFIVSLSMALALSDLASRNVEINSLFIDEGFGTLDPETLDQTLDTLEKLQAESSKTIGIISHVDSLKERIATQIQLKRNGQGYSSLEVVG